MAHASLAKWEKKLKAIFDTIDDTLEEKYGKQFPLHPSRPQRGTTASKKYDGLFNVDAAFSLGVGSKFGPGYVLQIRMVTLSQVPKRVREKIENFVVERLREELPKQFPNRKLSVSRDGNVYRIHGDLSLGQLY